MWGSECSDDDDMQAMSSPTPLAEACNTFSLSLFKQLSENNTTTGNVFYSPLSIASALAMVLLGARGNTATQMSEVLHFNDDVHVDFSKLLGDLNKPGKPCALSLANRRSATRKHSKLLGDLNKPGKPCALSLANRLYGEQSHRFAEEFLSATRKHYDAQLKPVDFIGNADGARLSINGWVKKQTQGKIKDLLAPGVVDGRTRLVLVNAIYFKAKWQRDYEFYESSTVDEPFRLSKTERKPVKMMYQENYFPLVFIPEVNCQILELPYSGRDLSMLIFLPVEMEDDTTGLEKLEKELTHGRFVDWTHPGKMERGTVEVGLPRFKIEATYDMKDVLIKMGMVDAFDDTECDFSGMSPAKGLVLSKVVHKAFVEVNEEGTEAAAATVNGYWSSSDSPSESDAPPRFVADHPFLFFIRHNPTMSILFAGRYCSPP